MHINTKYFKINKKLLLTRRNGEEGENFLKLFVNHAFFSGPFAVS